MPHRKLLIQFRLPFCHLTNLLLFTGDGKAFSSFRMASTLVFQDKHR